jgi:subtilisin family serine protease
VQTKLICTETDAGNDPYHVGTTSTQYNSVTDECIGKNVLVEYYCKGRILSEKITCPHGCIEGACFSPILDQLTLTLATTQLDYTIGEQILLTGLGEKETTLFVGEPAENLPAPRKNENVRHPAIALYEGDTEEGDTQVSPEEILTLESIDEELQENAQNKANKYIIQFHNDPLVYIKEKGREHAMKALNAEREGVRKQLSKGVKHDYRLLLNAVHVEATADELAAIRKDPAVKSISENRLVEIALDTSVPITNAPEVWNTITTNGNESVNGSGITIAILDTGVDYTHDDLGGCIGTTCKVIGGYDFVNDVNDPMDDHGHGTHCAATAAGDGLFKGVAPGASIVAYKVLDQYGNGYESDILEAMERAIDPNMDGDISDHYDILSLSLGIRNGNPDDLLSVATDTAVAAGAIVVVAAGNEGPRLKSIRSPGTARTAITVGATYDTDQLASFSSRGPVVWDGGMLIKPDLSAPGVNICAAKATGTQLGSDCAGTGNHVMLQGTSMATPHVAGAAALLIQQHPEWTPVEIKSTLTATAANVFFHTELGGDGRLDALAAATLDAPCIASLETNGVVRDDVAIMGVVECDALSHYQLYFGEPQSTDSELLLLVNGTGNTDGVIEILDTEGLDEGEYRLILRAYDIAGNLFEDRAIIVIDNFALDPIGNYGYLNGPTMLTGELYSTTDAQYKIMLDGYGLLEPETLCEGFTTNGEISCNFNTAGKENGEYFFILYVEHEGRWISDKSVRATFINELYPNWPVRYNPFPKGPPFFADLDGNGNEELITQTFRYCSTPNGNSCSGNIYRIYKDDAPPYSVSYHQLADGGYLGETINDYYPTVIPGEEERLAIMDWDLLGVMDEDGYLLSGFPVDWSYTGETDLRRILYDEEDERIVFGAVRHDTATVSMYAYDASGVLDWSSTLPGGSYDSWIAFHGLTQFKSRLGTLYGLVHGSFQPVDGGYYGSNYELFLDLVDKDGNYVHRQVLHDDPDFNAVLQSSKLPLRVLGVNVDDDPFTELVYFYTMVDMDAYRLDNYDPTAYHSWIKIVDDNGALLYELHFNDGKVMTDLIIAELDGEKSLIGTFQDTFGAADYINELRIFDAALEEQWRFGHGTGSQRIVHTRAADVDGDGLQEIIFSARPRWYQGAPSSLVVLSHDGLVQKEVVLFTDGEVEDFMDFSIGDFNGNGGLDVVLQTHYIPEDSVNVDADTHLFMFELYDEEPLVESSWPSNYGNEQHTHCFDCHLFPEQPLSILENPTHEKLEGELFLTLDRFNGRVWQEVKRVNEETLVLAPESSIQLSPYWNDKDVVAKEAGQYRAYAHFDTALGSKETEYLFDIE